MIKYNRSKRKGDTLKKTFAIVILITLIFSQIALSYVFSYEEKTEFDHDIRIDGTILKPIKETIGDLDGDGKDDLILREDNDLYFFLGKDIEGSPLDVTKNYSFMINNTNEFINIFPSSVLDFNEDGCDDIFFNVYSHYGFPYIDSSKVMVLLGNESLHGKVVTMDYYGDSPDFILNITGPTDTSTGFGSEIHYFDYNLDGYKDLFLNLGLSEPGHVSGMILGYDGKNISSMSNTSYLNYDFRILPELNTINKHYAGFGNELLIHDFDADGIKDIIYTDIDARINHVEDCGLTIVIYNNGTHLEGTYNISEFQVTWLYGGGGDFFGGQSDTGIDVGDINNDGIDELIISGSGADGINDQSGRCGEIAIIFQKPGRPQFIDLSVRSNIDVTIIGQTGKAVGLGVVSTGDYNGDGYDDIMFSDDATYSVAWDGGIYLWLGRDLENSVYTLTTCKYLFKGQSGTQLERYGYWNAFANVNGDEYLDLIISPQRGDFTDIYISSFSPPSIVNVTFDKTSAFRGQQNQMNIEINDDWTTAENMTVEVQSKISGDWFDVPLLSIDNSLGILSYDIKSNYSSELGFYSYRVKLTDQDGFSTGWKYSNNTVEVKNNLPSIWDPIISPRRIGRGYRINLNLHVRDYETPLNELNYTLRLRENNYSFFNIKPVEIKNNEEVKFEIYVPRDFEPVQSFIDISATDSDGGMTTRTFQLQLTIYNWTLHYDYFDISPRDLMRGNSTHVSFRLIDYDDNISHVYNISLDFLHVKSGVMRTFTANYTGSPYDRNYTADIRFENDWDYGRYDVILHTGAFDQIYFYPIMVHNNPLNVSQTKRTEYINESGIHHINITDMVNDPERGHDLFWNQTNVDEDFPFNMSLKINKNGTYLIINVDDNVTYDGVLSYNVSDYDGSFQILDIKLKINTTLPFVPVYDLDTNIMITYPSETNLSYITVNASLALHNTGNAAMKVIILPIGNSSSYLEPLPNDVVLFSGQSYYSNISFILELDLGMNYHGFGIEISYEGYSEMFWRNVTINRIEDIEDIPPSSPESKPVWPYVLGIIILIIIIVIVLVVVLRKRSKNGLDISDSIQENQSDIHTDSEYSQLYYSKEETES